MTDCTFLAPTRQEAAALPSRVGVCPTTFTFAQQSTIGQSTHPGAVRFLAERQREHEEGEEGKEVEMEGGQEEEGEGEEAVRPLGGFERLFATYQSMGLGLIFFIADINGPVDAEVGLGEGRSLGVCFRGEGGSIYTPSPPIQSNRCTPFPSFPST